MAYRMMAFNATTFEVQNKYTETIFLFVIQRLASPAKR
jgi:hypothetical protein